MTKSILVSIGVIFLLAVMAVTSIHAAGTDADSSQTSVQAEKISVTGTVLDGKGRPVVGARVLMEDENGNVLAVRSGAKGQFAISGLVEKAVYVMYVSHGSVKYPTEARSFLRGDDIIVRP